ncbi:hypothetical protein AKJ55_00320 [candidate division MSBL1 archaeon SCGC-AAA382M17]|uniref:Archaeal Type IV pilin N-terminal domain-containing protein n=1 Tax=candidate division MSBL1 archaeon SCGC-AAA382M17 TaxID=1698284 RepID=A0ABR5TK41_9EURY|nr:hypothetical protein AKJ55_00320 [candidate division MSBL1 archaeon SCGC-AAA382M17]
MEISRIVRVLLTLIMVVTFIIITVAAYQQTQTVASMTTLSDSTSSIVTALASQDLAWSDETKTLHPYVLEASKLENLRFSRLLGGDNLVFQATIIYNPGNKIENIGPYGPDLPEDKMTSSLSVPVSLRKNNSTLPAKLKVVSWYG